MGAGASVAVTAATGAAEVAAPSEASNTQLTSNDTAINVDGEGGGGDTAATNVPSPLPPLPPLLLRFANSELTKPADASDLSDSRLAAIVEVQRIRQALNDPMVVLQNGKVMINYQMYNELFDIENGALSVEKLDDEYALSFAMPGCKLELITCTPQEKIDLDVKRLPVPFVQKSDDKTNFINMNVLEKYYVVVYENEEERKKAAERYAANLAHEGIAKNEGKREGEKK
jgi:hypothetical protein